MLRTVALISLFLFISMSEPTNFDYSSHGDDWNCPKNGIFYFIELLSNPQFNFQQTKEFKNQRILTCSATFSIRLGLLTF